MLNRKQPLAARVSALARALAGLTASPERPDWRSAYPWRYYVLTAAEASARRAR